MRSRMSGALLGAGLVIAAFAARGSSQPVPVPAGPGEVVASAPQSGQLITHVTAVAGQPQTVIVIDPNSRVMGVYHVDSVSGEIALKSVRNFTWDLQMIEFNSGVPSPQDIRSGLPR
jgi:hypothetical protein